MSLRCRHEKGKIDADGGMSCYMYFTFFSIVFQSYQDDGKVITKGCEQWNFVNDYDKFASTRVRSRRFMRRLEIELYTVKHLISAVSKFCFFNFLTLYCGIN